jgi:hypothetical protein
MARTRAEKSGKPTKLEVVRKILEGNPKANPDEIVKRAKEEFETDINRRTAAVYRYLVLNPKKARGRRVRNGAPAMRPVKPPTVVGDGLEDLIRAAEKMGGWSRLKTVIEGITRVSH